MQEKSTNLEEEMRLYREASGMLSGVFSALYIWNVKNGKYSSIVQQECEKKSIPSFGDYAENGANYINTYIHPSDRDKIYDFLSFETLQKEAVRVGICFKVSKRFRRLFPQGYEWVEITAVWKEDSNTCLILHRNIADEMAEVLEYNEQLIELNRKLKQQARLTEVGAKRFIAISDTIMDMILEYSFQNNTVTAINRLEEKHAILPKNTLTVSEWQALIAKEDFEKYKVAREKMLSVGSCEPIEVKLKTILENQEYRWYKMRFSMILDERKKPYSVLILLEDVEEQHKKLSDFKKKAERDLLTGLYNNVTMHEKALKILAQGEEKPKYSLLIFDVDKYKEINDKYGHLTGDAILADVARIFKENFRKEDLISRIGGDEFEVLLKDVVDCDQITRFFETIQEQLLRLNYDKISEKISVSMGVRIVDGEAVEYRKVFADADRALYHAKNTGRNRCCFYREI